MVDLAQVTDATIQLLPQVDLVNRCFYDVILPTGDKPINDGFLSTGLPNYKEFWQAMTALSSESQNYDGNGQYTRFQPGGGSMTVSTGAVGAQGKLYGNAILEPIGSQPAFPGKKPPYNRELPLLQEPAAEPGQRSDRRRTVRRAIRKHLRDFIALLFLFVVALGVASYILSNQRFYLPNWVPVVGTDFYTVEAELSTAQAVVPGQGQTVNIAGVKIGDIGKVELENGHAVVDDEDPAQVRADLQGHASCCCGPKTGLKDMYLAMSPGTPAGRRAEGVQGRRRQAECRIPVANTMPDVNPDEMLASLDSDTRDYLVVLAERRRRRVRRRAGQAEGAFVGKPGEEQSAAVDLRETFKRFEPTGRDTVALTRRGGQAAPQPQAADPQLPAALHGARAPATSSSSAVRRAPRTPTSRPSPAGPERCARRCGSSRAPSPPRRTRSPAPTSWPRSSAPRSRRSGRRPAPSGPTLRASAPVPARDHADHQGRDPPVRARSRARRCASCAAWPSPLAEATPHADAAPSGSSTPC